jgi:mannose-6-phosphate isomerase-like protein (cupin superfamily)
LSPAIDPVEARMRTNRLLLLAGAIAVCAGGAAKADATVKIIPSDDAAKMVFDPARAKEAAGVASGQGGFSMALTKRTASGHVEKHMGFDEELVIQEGDVVLNYGGDGVNAKENRPGEWQADSIAHGKSVELHPGDIVVIPANTWHEEVLKSPRMRYVLIHSTPKG